MEEMEKSLIAFVIRILQKEQATEAELSAMTSVASMLLNKY